jgi:hypothetical protein
MYRFTGRFIVYVKANHGGKQAFAWQETVLLNAMWSVRREDRRDVITRKRVEQSLGMLVFTWQPSSPSILVHTDWLAISTVKSRMDTLLAGLIEKRWIEHVHSQ